MRRRLGIWIVAVAAACGAPPKQSNTVASAPENSADGLMTAAGEKTALEVPGMGEPVSLEFVLRAGAQKEPAPERVRNVQGTPVSDAEADALLKGLPALPKDAALDASFAKRPGSAPPPTAVVEIKDVFGTHPEGAGKPKLVKIPLEVLRMSPEGEVDLAPELTVTFNQPMIALSSHAEAAGAVPVKLSPTPKGRYRWIGTRSVVFTPEGRFPMATEYTVEVPAGTRSATEARSPRPARNVSRPPHPSWRRSTPPMTYARPSGCRLWSSHASIRRSIRHD